MKRFFQVVLCLCLLGLAAPAEAGLLVTYDKRSKGKPMRYGRGLALLKSTGKWKPLFPKIYFSGDLIPLHGTPRFVSRVRYPVKKLKLRKGHFGAVSIQPKTLQRFTRSRRPLHGNFLLGAKYYGDPLLPLNDGSLMLPRSGKFDLSVYKRRKNGRVSRFFRKFGLYAFQPRKDGSYAYVTWGRTGRESNHFVDVIPGKPMKLWFKPKGRRARVLAKAPAILRLRWTAKGKRIVYLSPYRDRKKKVWQVMSVDPSRRQKSQMLAEIPAPSHRGAPKLFAWYHLPWIAYRSSHYSPPSKWGRSLARNLRYERMNVLTQKRSTLFQLRSSKIRIQAASPHGYITLLQQLYSRSGSRYRYQSRIQVLDVRTQRPVFARSVKLRVWQAFYHPQF